MVSLSLKKHKHRTHVHSLSQPSEQSERALNFSLSPMLMCSLSVLLVFLSAHACVCVCVWCRIYGGWSFAQVATISHLLVEQLGYVLLHEHRAVVDTSKVKHSFDLIPFQLEWTAILLKPIRVDENKCTRVNADK